MLGFIYGYSLIKVIWYSLVEWDGFTPTIRFNMFANFRAIVVDPNFLESLKNSMTILIAVIPVLILIAVVATQFLYMGIAGAKIYRILFFLPVVLPVVVVGVVFSFILHNNGPLNQFLCMLKLDFLAVDWFGNQNYAIYALIFIIIWKDIGFAIVLFLARLMNAPLSLYESARIDGANEFQLMWHITIPQLKSVIILYSVLSSIGLLINLFGYIFVTTGGGPGYSTTVLEYFIYLYTFRYGRLGEGSAVAVILFLITVVLSIIYFREYEKEERT